MIDTKRQQYNQNIRQASIHLTILELNNLHRLLFLLVNGTKDYSPKRANIIIALSGSSLIEGEWDNHNMLLEVHI